MIIGERMGEVIKGFFFLWIIYVGSLLEVLWMGGVEMKNVEGEEEVCCFLIDVMKEIGC